MRWPSLALVAGLLSVFADQAPALRCGNALVSQGDTRYEVERQCGSPDYVDVQNEAFVAGVGPVGEIEEWYYNRGPQQLIRVLVFRNGELVREETGDHGFSRLVRDNCTPNELRRGMSKYELLVRCGEPVDRESYWTLGDIPSVQHPIVGVGRVDEWIYDFGGGRFLRHVRMVDGRITDVRLGDRID